MIINEIKHTKNSETISFKNGYCIVRIQNVKKYAKFAVDNFPERPEFVYRGQENADWKLESTFQRISCGRDTTNDDLKNHLITFKSASRGRRGQNPKDLEEDEWWATGQHYGLATPLLDWTRSHWVALFFAFSKITTNKCRAIYAADLNSICEISKDLGDNGIKVIDPEVHDNPRLTSQAGILLRLPIKWDLEEWIQKNFKGSDRVALIKIEIPNQDVNYIIRDLNRMNINHLSLFPDFVGACYYTNTLFQDPNMAIAMPYII